MKKYNFLVLTCILTSCSEKIDNCTCKFNLDILVKNEKIYNETNIKFYSVEYLDRCFKKLEKGKETTIEEAYLYYHGKCPNYELEYNKNTNEK